MSELISLIVCTLGRRTSLARLLTSLQMQADRTFEVIVVDQNEEGYLDPVLASFVTDLSIRRLCSAKGLSRARNIGLQECRGDIVGFPDDDCWYDQGVTHEVRRFFQNTSYAVLTGRTVDSNGVESVSDHRAASGPIDRLNVFRSGNSNTLFVRRDVALEVDGFDETLGVGAGTPFQSGEETDFILRCMESGHLAYYARDFTVRHAQSSGAPSAQVTRARAYSVGFGRLMRTHGYGLPYLGNRIGRSLLRGALCLATGDINGARQRYSWVVGSLHGYLVTSKKCRSDSSKTL